MAVTEKQTATAGVWGINVRQIVYAALGAALYGGLGYLTNFVQLSAGNVSFRPAIVIPLLFGVLFGPWVGLFTGAVGNLLGDLISGYAMYWNWDLGNGLLGFIAGLVVIYTAGRYFSRRNYILAEVFSAVGIIVGIAFAAYNETWLSKYTFGAVTATYFVPAVLSDLINGLILLPILLLAYGAAVRRTGRS